jgi:8-hydroxy-5-deazaflavin:NADPH oxidoreductase
LRIAIIGAGNFGSALARRSVQAGHAVSLSDSPAGSERLRAAVVETGATAAPTAEAVVAAELIVLAVPFSAIDDVLTAGVIAAATGKTVVDVTNPLAPDRMSLTLGCTTSGGEQIAAKLPRSHVVKAFNTLLAANLAAPTLGGTKLLVPVAGDDDASKRTVLDLAAQLGFDAVDAGPLTNARYLEPAIVLLLQLAYGMQMGTGIGLALARG